MRSVRKIVRLGASPAPEDGQDESSEKPLDGLDLSLIAVALVCPGGFFWIMFGVQAGVLDLDGSPADVDIVPGLLIGALILTLAAVCYGDLIAANPDPEGAHRGPAYHVGAALAASRVRAARAGAWVGRMVAGGAALLGLAARGVLLVMAAGAVVRHLVASQALFPAFWWLDFVSCTLLVALAASFAAARDVALPATLATGLAMMQLAMTVGIACVLLFFRWRNWLDFQESSWLVEEWFVTFVPSSKTGPLVQAVLASAAFAGFDAAPLFAGEAAGARRAARRSLLGGLARAAWGAAPLLYAAATLALNSRLHCLRADLPSDPTTSAAAAAAAAAAAQSAVAATTGGGGVSPDAAAAAAAAAVVEAATGRPGWRRRALWAEEQQTCGTGFPGLVGELLLQVSSVVFGDGAYLAYAVATVAVLLSLAAGTLATLAAAARLLAALAADGSLPAPLAPAPGRRPSPLPVAGCALALLVGALYSARSFASSLAVLLLASAASAALSAAAAAAAALLAPLPDPPPAASRPARLARLLRRRGIPLAALLGSGLLLAVLAVGFRTPPDTLVPHHQAALGLAAAFIAAHALLALACERWLGWGRPRPRWKAADGKCAWAAVPGDEGEEEAAAPGPAGLPAAPPSFASVAVQEAEVPVPPAPAAPDAAPERPRRAWARPVAALLGRLRRGDAARRPRAAHRLSDATHDEEDALAV